MLFQPGNVNRREPRGIEVPLPLHVELYPTQLVATEMFDSHFTVEL